MPDKHLYPAADRSSPARRRVRGRCRAAGGRDGLCPRIRGDPAARGQGRSEREIVTTRDDRRCAWRACPTSSAREAERSGPTCAWRTRRCNWASAHHPARPAAGDGHPQRHARQLFRRRQVPRRSRARPTRMPPPCSRRARRSSTSAAKAPGPARQRCGKATRSSASSRRSNIARRWARRSASTRAARR